MARLRALIDALALSLAVITPASAQTFTVDSIVQQANDLAWDPFSEQLFGSVPGSVGPGGNSVVPIDPLSLVVGAPIPVGSEPAKLAMSDDGEYLYAGLAGAPAVRRVHVPSLSPDLLIQLGNGSFGPRYAEDLAVQPGHSRVFAVSRKRLGVSPRHDGVAVFEDAVQRPDQTSDHTGANVIEWSDIPEIVYGYNNETTEFGTRTMEVDAQGIQVIQVLDTGITGFGTDIEYADGVLYATTGVAIDAPTGLLLGTYPGVGSSAKVAVNPALNRTYYLSGNQLRTYELSSFLLLDTQTIPDVQGAPRNLVHWGATSLAFSTTLGQVFVLTGEESCTGSWSTYCTALPNSTGGTASMSILGSLSLIAGDTTLECSGVPPNKPGIFIMGAERGNLPFGDGILCLDLFGAIHRVGYVISTNGAGEVALPLPFGDLPQITGGSDWNFQFWFRDHTPGGFNLSDAAFVSFCP